MRAPVNPIITEPTRIFDIPAEAMAGIMIISGLADVLATAIVGPKNTLPGFLTMLTVGAAAYRLMVKLAIRDPNFACVFKAIAMRNRQETPLVRSTYWIDQAP